MGSNSRRQGDTGAKRGADRYSRQMSLGREEKETRSQEITRKTDLDNNIFVEILG